MRSDFHCAKSPTRKRQQKYAMSAARRSCDNFVFVFWCVLWTACSTGRVTSAQWQEEKEVAITNAVSTVKGKDDAIASSSPRKEAVLIGTSELQVHSKDAKDETSDVQSLDDRLLDLQLRLEDDLNKVEEDAKLAAVEAAAAPEQPDQNEMEVSVLDKAEGRSEEMGKRSVRPNRAGAVSKKGKDRAAVIDAKLTEAENPHARTGTSEPPNSNPKLDAAAPVANSTGVQQSVQLVQDISHVREDINSLLQTVTEAERELEHAKAKLHSEEQVFQHKSAAIETEKILDDLHRGKLNIKVDYVTGELLADSKMIEGNEKTKKVNSESKVDGDAVVETSVDGTNVRNAEAEIGMVDGSRDELVDEADIVEQEQNGDDGANAVSLDAIIDAATTRMHKSDSASSPSQDGLARSPAGGEDKVHKAETIIKEIESNPDLQIRLKEEIEYLRADSDPAVMSMDMQLLLDVVTLAITAALFGLVAVFLRLPPTAGFLLGGMLIGPSCWDLIEEMRQVQTLAQFGCIFLLFEQGLLYSQTYSDEVVSGSALATGQVHVGDEPLADNRVGSNDPNPVVNGDRTVHLRRGDSGRTSSSSTRSSFNRRAQEAEHDSNVVGVIVLVLLVFSALAIFVLTEAVTSAPEAIIVASSVALCSTTIVSENLHAAHIASTTWGRGVLKMIAIQDLFMVPLLALPEIIESLYTFLLDDDRNLEDEEQDARMPSAWPSISKVLCHMFMVTSFVKGSMLLARHIVNAAVVAEARMMGHKGELFTLSIVAYALLMATISEELQLSIEAGAVFAGIVLMKSRHVPMILSSIQPITSVFGGMYLTSLGMIISPSFVLSQARSIIELVVFISIFKLTVVSTVLNRFFDYGITASLAVGSAMAQISEISLLVLAKSQRLGLVSRRTYLMLIPTTCILLTLAPFSTAHLRRLKLQEITGSDDGRIPPYLCILKRLSILRHRARRGVPIHRRSADERDLEQDHVHRT